MLKGPGRSGAQTGTEILLEAMSQDKIHLARFVLDALDRQIVDSQTDGAHAPLVASVLLPDGRSRCSFAELLLQRGAAVNRRDADGRTALSYACEKGYLDAVKVLVRHGADPEIVDRWGNSALMYAAVAGHGSVVQFLVRAFKRLGLQIDRQNKVGNSAMKVAEFLGHAGCVSALGSTKADRGSEARSPQGRARRGRLGDTSEGKLDALQTCNDANPAQNRSPMRRSRLPWMDSIEELEKENGCCSSGMLSPPPPPRTSARPHKTPDQHLPRLTLSCSVKNSVFFSPRPNRTTAAPSAPSALGVLLTPILAHRRGSESGTERGNTRKFQDSYYKKRFSLPLTIRSPAPPEPLPKSRAARRREASPCKAEPPRLRTHDSANASSTTFSALSNKLLRRFTSPEIKKDASEPERGSVLVSGGIPRSETFPLGARHPQVGSKPSIDSISSVKCEFDFQLRTPK